MENLYKDGWSEFFYFCRHGWIVDMVEALFENGEPLKVLKSEGKIYSVKWMVEEGLSKEDIYEVLYGMRQPTKTVASKMNDLAKVFHAILKYVVLLRKWKQG
ncbi:hypothetical protein SESBI_19126 [Sesbania bispinosa]|nr:hypothetical protein SESBI_19126 [Sesbania bispinosa]